MKFAAISSSNLKVVIKLNFVIYNRIQREVEIKENINIYIFSSLNEKLRKGSPKANISINSTPPARPIKDEVVVTAILIVIK
jgi:hypothetical protein